MPNITQIFADQTHTQVSTFSMCCMGYVCLRYQTSVCDFKRMICLFTETLLTFPLEGTLEIEIPLASRPASTVVEDIIFP